MSRRPAAQVADAGPAVASAPPPIGGPGWAPPRWAAPVSLLLTLIGLGIAIYLTDAHYSESVVLACPETGVVNCQKVTTSAQSYFLGVPVALLGLVYFVVSLPFALPFAWRRPERWVRLGRLALSVGGVLFVLYLVYAELFILNAICLWCTAVHVVTVLLFAVVATATALAADVYAGA